MLKMMAIVIAVLLLIGAVASEFPTVNYTGQACTLAPFRRFQRCAEKNKTALITWNNFGDPSNGTHILVIVGKQLTMTCCTPPKTNRVGDINATLAEREISYLLHSGRSVPVMKGNQLYRNATSNYITGNNSMCEYTTVSIPYVTYSEVGTWVCGADDDDTQRVELHVIVPSYDSDYSCESGGEIKYPWVTVKCSIDRYSPTGINYEWRLGTNSFNHLPLTSDGKYGSGSISVTGLKLRSFEGLLVFDRLISSCYTFNNTYDTAAGDNYAMTVCQSTSSIEYIATKLYPDNGYVGLPAHVGWRETIFYTYKFQLQYRVSNSVRSSLYRNEGYLLFTFANILFMRVASIEQRDQPSVTNFLFLYL